MKDVNQKTFVSEINRLAKIHGTVTRELLLKEGIFEFSEEERDHLEKIRALARQGKTQGKVSREDLENLGNFKQSPRAAQKKNIEKRENLTPKENENMPVAFEKNEIRNAMNKVLRGREIPQEFRAALTKTESGGLLIPEDLQGDIEAAKKYNKSMSQYVDVIPVTTAKGWYTTEDEGNHGELVEINDLTELNEQDMKLKGVPWDLKRYGSFTSMSEDLYNDSQFDLMTFFENAHAEKAAKTENKLIFDAVRIKLVPKPLAGVPALKTSINKDLNPALENEILVVTNQDGFEILSKLDANGNPIEFLRVENDGPKRYFDIYRFEVYSNNDFPSVGGKAPFLYGSFKRAVKLFTDNQTDVLFSKHPFGIQKQVCAIRGIEALDVKVIPGTTQLIYGEIPIPV